jgi:hypothetical protein
MFDRLFTFIGQMFSSGSGVSFARVASAVLMVFCLGWDTAYLLFTMLHWKALFPMGVTIHDVLPPVATLLGQVTFFTAPYGINKALNAASNSSPQNGQG